MILAFPSKNGSFRLADDPATRSRETYTQREALKRCGGWYNGIEWQIPRTGLIRLRGFPFVNVCILRRAKVESICHLPECWVWAKEGDVQRATVRVFCAECETHYNAAQIIEVQIWHHHGESKAAQPSLLF